MGRNVSLRKHHAPHVGEVVHGGAWHHLRPNWSYDGTIWTLCGWEVRAVISRSDGPVEVTCASCNRRKL